MKCYGKRLSDESGPETPAVFLSNLTSSRTILAWALRPASDTPDTPGSDVVLGSEVSLGRFFQDRYVQCLISYQFTQTGILLLQCPKLLDHV